MAKASAGAPARRAGRGKRGGGDEPSRRPRPAKPQPAQRNQPGQRKHSRSKPSLDVYEAEEASAEEERNPMRFDEVEKYEYSGLPENFEDEEIDEDEAFNSEDEAKYGDLLGSMGGGKKRAKEKGTDDEGESGGESGGDEGGEGSDDSGEFQDLSDLLGPSAPAKPAAASKKPTKRGRKAAEADEEEEEEPELDEEEEDGDEGLHEAMLAAAGLKRKRGREGARREPERHEHMEESEFNLDAGSGDEGRGGVSLRDLVGGLQATTGYGGLKRQLERLGKAQAAPPALEGPAQERAGRAVAYAEASKEVSKWVPVVKRNREAEQLRFPLNAAPRQNLSSAALAGKFEAATGLEREVAGLLEASGLAEGAAAKGEELELKKLSVEEVKARQAELARMRSLLFYHELKCKRIKKIKSKTYHKIAKKERGRELAKAAEAGELDEEQAREAEMRAARDRAKERMTLKHRSRSKWMRQALERGDRDDPHTREAIAEHLQRAQALRAKAEGAGEGSGSSSGSEDGDIDAMIEAERRDLAKGLGEGEGGKPAGGLLGLKFMQKAAERRRREAEELLDELVKARAEEAEGEGEGEGASAPAPPPAAAAAAKGGRRLVGVPSAAAAAAASSGKGGGRGAKKAAAAGGDADFDQASDEGGSASGGEEVATEAPRGKGRAARGGAEQAGGSTWEQMELPGGGAQVDGVSLSRGRKARTSGAVAAGAAADAPLFAGPAFADPPAAGPSSSRKPGPVAAAPAPAPAATAGAEAGAGAEGEENPWMKKGEEAGPGARRRGEAGGAGRAGGGLTAEDLVLPEEGAAEGAPGLLSGRAADRALVERAFAGPDLQREFEEEKAREVAASLPKLDVVVLPGWGAWGGEGARPAKTPKFAEEAARRHAAAQAKALAGRADAGLRHVVVNEKLDAKAAKYTLEAVPHPYKSREQYERAVRNPLGRDWNPTASHRALVASKIVAPAGAIIEPIKQKSKKSVAKASTRKPLGAAGAALV